MAARVELDSREFHRGGNRGRLLTRSYFEGNRSVSRCRGGSSRRRRFPAVRKSGWQSPDDREFALGMATISLLKLESIRFESTAGPLSNERRSEMGILESLTRLDRRRLILR